MRVLRRNTQPFTYRKRTGQEEVIADGLHTGNWVPAYAEGVTYRGNISIPSGFAANEYFGINTRYTHVLMMDDPDADIAEDGLIEWRGDEYLIKAVRRSLNVLTAAIEQVTRDRSDPEPTPPNGTEGGTTQDGTGQDETQQTEHPEQTEPSGDEP